MGKKLVRNFTQEILDHLPLPPEGKRAVYYDKQQRNLCLIVTNNGTKAFYVRRTVNKRTTRFMIGRYGELDIRRAREKSAKYAAAIGEGKTKQEILNKPLHETTLNGFWHIFLERHAKPHKQSWRYDQGLYTLHVEPKPFARYILSQIKMADIHKLHVDLGNSRGQVVANRVISLLSAMFNKATDWGYCSTGNPVSKVKKYRETSRDRFLKGDELPAFWEALNSSPDVYVRDYVLLSLFAPARKCNILSMRWDEIDISAREWRIPKTKNGDALTVPLIDMAMDILTKRRAVSTSEYVFPARKPYSTTPHMVEPKRAWENVLVAAGMKDDEGNWLTEKLTLHDLRRTSGSWQTIMGANSFIVGKSLGHKSSKATQVYARLDLDPVRVSLNRAAEEMVRLSKPVKK